MTEESLEIIAMLRDARFGWIADELVESLALGRQTVKTFREPGSTKSTKGTSIEPFDREEEMELIVETLAQYFIVMPRAWAAARARFAREDTFSEIRVKRESSWTQKRPAGQEDLFPVALGIAGNGNQAFQNFNEPYLHEIVPSLRRVLSQLWPHGPEDFKNRFCPPEDAKK